MIFRKFIFRLKIFLLITIFFGVFGILGIAEAERYDSKSGATLDFLKMKINEEFQKVDLLQKGPVIKGSLTEILSRIQKTNTYNVSIRFDHELSDGEIEELEDQGLLFKRIDGSVLQSGNVYGASVAPKGLDVLTNRHDVIRVESTWKPALHYPLDVSAEEINANDMWKLLDGGGSNITGSGITIADFDSGIDVFHPGFWFADGGTYSWIDANGNGVFDAGTDAVDLNVNGSDDSGETLDFFDAGGNAGGADGIFQADMDWLYNDANNNHQRDFGTANGFTESDPTFGERIFIAEDGNGNNALDIGENLIALGTSKVFRTMNSGIERVRGTDLILSDDDTNGHGTSVCGILNGGIIGMRRFVGIAPDAELLVSHGTDYTVYIPWARTNGADIMLYEFGKWVQEFMDGSSNLEQMIDAEAAGGIVQIVPAGNLGHKDKHAQSDVAAGGNVNFTFNVPNTDNAGTAADESIDYVYITALWRTPANDMDFEVTTPTPSVVNLPASPPDSNWHSTTSGDGHTVWYRREDSSRGTAKYDIIIERSTNVVLGGWTVQADNSSAIAQHVDMYIADDRTSWSGGALWTNNQANENTIDWPATADSAITVASYSTRGWGGVAAGDLSSFSPEGPRIDGTDIMDIAAPGNFDIGSAMSKDQNGGSLGAYRWFSGTSAAGPHVAGVCALLLQWDPLLTHAQVETLLHNNAKSDTSTGITPNEEWGYGKLDILAAVNEPPVADANGPYSTACQGSTTQLLLDGSGSSDPNAGDILEYSWNTDCAGGAFDDPNSSTPLLTVASIPGCDTCNVTLTVSDLAGSSDNSSAVVEISDTEAPLISCPSDMTIECDQSKDPANTGVATATDTCDETPGATYSDVESPGACPQEFIISRTWTAIDDCGNESECLQTINVVDTTPPVLASPVDITIECDESTDPSNTGTATATDNCDPIPVVTYTEVETPGDCAAEKTVLRTWTAIDSCGNESNHEQTIHVVDTTAPEISSNAPATIVPPDAPISFTATATDNCDATPFVEITAYDCRFFTKKGKEIDKTESCVVGVVNDTITILDSGGVGCQITWTIVATDECGNISERNCLLEVVNPMQ